MAASNQQVGRVRSSQEFAPDNYFSINATTLSHIARLIRDEFGQVVLFLTTNGLTDANMRQVAKDLAIKTEAVMVDLLIKNKEKLFKINGLGLTDKEIDVLQKYIAMACIYISQIIYKALCYARDFLSDTSERVGELPLFNSFTQFHTTEAIKFEDDSDFDSDNDSSDSEGEMTQNRLLLTEVQTLPE